MSATREQTAADRMRQVVAPTDALAIETGLSALHRAQRRRVVLRTTLRSAAALAAVAMLVVVASRWSHALPPVAEGGTSDGATRFADGSVVTTVAAARIVVREVSPTRTRIALEHGDIDVDVTRHPERQFIVEVGDVTITVLGTHFAVHRQHDDRVVVHVDRGRVRVQWPDGARELGVGEEGTFPPEAPEADANTASAPIALDPVPPEPRAADPSERTATPVRRTPDWRPLARGGGYDEAYAIIAQSGPSIVRDEVDDLLLAGDAARLSGHPDAALPFLERVVVDHPTDSRAPMAAFTRGRLLLAEDEPAEAAAAFERALAVGARGSLAENALARAVEAHARAGELSRASALARDYLTRYPSGRWVDTVRQYEHAP